MRDDPATALLSITRRVTSCAPLICTETPKVKAIGPALFKESVMLVPGMLCQPPSAWLDQVPAGGEKMFGTITPPAGPCGPCGPVAPVAPAGPVGPAGPVAPTAPAGPVRPVAPVSPFGP